MTTKDDAKKTQEEAEELVEELDRHKYLMTKRKREFIIKFKSMQEILLTNNCWFDNHGNLCVAGDYNSRDGVEMLSPSHFVDLGKMKKFPQPCSFPHWCKEYEYEDIFWPNIALRQIASGKLSPEDQVQIAKDAVVLGDEPLEKSNKPEAMEKCDGKADSNNNNV